MENLVFTQLSIPEVRRMFREEIENFFANKVIARPENVIDDDEIGKGAEFASKLTGKAVPTIYDLVHKRLIPHSKRGGDLYFSRRELTEWMLSGRRKTQGEIAQEVTA
jgi:hypothetical protein